MISSIAGSTIIRVRSIKLMAVTSLGVQKKPRQEARRVVSRGAYAFVIGGGQINFSRGSFKRGGSLAGLLLQLVQPSGR